MTERLYVDDRLVDVGKDVNITMSIVSNLFSDVSKLKGNASYTIKLPKTAANMAVFGYADRVDSRTTMAYRKHVARFYRNGVEIFKDADCSLQSASDEGYEVVIVWGCRPKFTDIIKQNMTLRDLQSTASILFEETPTLTHYDDFMTNGYGYLRMKTRWETKEEPTEWHTRNDSGEFGVGWQKITRKGEETKGTTNNGSRRVFVAWKNNHPCVSVKWILGRILADMGVEFKWTGAAKTLVESLAIPCVTKDANELTYTGQQMVAQWYAQPNGYGGKISMSVYANDSVFGNLNTTLTTLTVLTDADLMVNAEITLRHLWDDVFEYVEGIGSEETHTFAYKDFFKAAEVIIEVKHGDSSTDEYRIGNSEMFFVGDLYEKNAGLIEVLTGGGIISVEQGDEISVKLVHTGDQSYRNWNITGGMSAKAVDGSDVPWNAYFPIVENLPDIKVVDFVKFLCAVTGTFPLQKASGNVVEFAQFNILQENIANAVDWTNRVRAKTTANVPQKIGYRVDGWAKHNHYRWKEDEKTAGGYDGDLTIDDDTLDEERDVVTFPFAASDMEGNVALVPLYERIYEYDEHGALIDDPVTYEYGKCEPRIVQVVGEGSENGSTKFALDMQTIIGEQYGLLSGCLGNAKIIEETIELTDREIAEFDETIPVWLAQYGSYFAVLEIKMQGDGLSDVKMIRIKNDYNHGDVPVVVYYTISTTFTHVTAASVPSRVAEDGELTIVLTPDTDYEISSVVVVMGETTLSNVYDSATHTIYIEHVTDNVSIEAVATQVLPYDAVVEYITASGTQRIDTGIVPDDVTELEIDVKITSMGASVCVIGTRHSNISTTSQEYKRLAIYLNNSNKLGGNLYQYDSGWVATGLTTVNNRIVFAYKNGNFTANNNTVASHTSTWPSNTGHIGIFRAMLYDGTWDDSTNRTLSGNIYGCKIWKNGTLVRNYIPVRKDNVGYLYDQVSGNLFRGASGYGDFSYGADITI